MWAFDNFFYNMYDVIQARPQSNFKKITLATHDYVENVYLLWFVNWKTIEINLCNAVNFP